MDLFSLMAETDRIEAARLERLKSEPRQIKKIKTIELTDIPYIPLLDTCAKADQILSAAIEKLRNPPPAPVTEPVKSLPTELVFPTTEDFNDLYNTYSSFRKPISAEVSEDLITLKCEGAGQKPLQLTTYALLELLADKYKNNFISAVDLRSSVSPLPDFEKIDSVLQEKMKWIKVGFVDMFECSDKNIQTECIRYHDFMSIPLVLRLRFLLWEKSLNNIKIQNAIVEGIKNKDKEVRGIAADYAAKLDSEKVAFRTQIEQMKRDVQKYKMIAVEMKDSKDDLQTKYQEVAAEHDKLYDGKREAESSVERIAMELSDTKRALEKAEKELAEMKAKYEAVPWIKMQSAGESPVFYNKSSGQIVSFPDSFYSAYMPVRKDGDGVVYSNQEGKEFTIPESLLLNIGSIVKKAGAGKSGSSGIDIDNLKPNDKKILGAIPKDGEAKTIFEISVETKIDKDNLYKYIPNLVEKGIIAEKFDEDKDANTYIGIL